MTEPDLATRAGGASGRKRGTGAGAAATSGQPGRPGRIPVLATARQHWLLAILLAAGLVLRVLALIAYQPALVYVDSLKYLYGASPGSDPLGYLAVLRPILLVGNLTVVAAVQHLAGLAMGGALYLILLRRGTSRWLAAVAAAPVLLDGYQVQMEQMIMPDIWFEVLVVLGVGLLLWRPAPGLRAAAAAGLVLGASATVRQIGEVLIFPLVLFLLVAMIGTGRVIRTTVAAIVAFAVPILAYCTVSYAATGHFWLARGQTTVGRVTAAADCATLRVPADVRPLCPTPAQQRFGPDWLEHSKYSPLHRAPIPAGASRGRLVGELTSAIKSQQPLRIAGSIASDSLRLFSVTRTSDPWSTPIWRWQFQASYPVYPNWITLGPHRVIVVGVQPRPFAAFRFSVLKPSYGGPAHVVRPIAVFLRSYQRGGGFTPGPLLALCAVAGLAGSVVALVRRDGDPRRRGLALACLLFTGCAAVLLLAPDVFEFSWRYQLPAVVTLPPAGMLGLSALLAGWGRRRARPDAGGAEGAAAGG
jgi:hypothetical protein